MEKGVGVVMLTQPPLTYLRSPPPPPPQKLRQELLSRQGSVDATCDSLSKLLQSADADTASDLRGSLAQLNGRYSAAQASQAEREAELKDLLPRLESYERLGADLQGFTQSRLKALGPVGQPEHSVDDYRQTLEVGRGRCQLLYSHETSS